MTHTKHQLQIYARWLCMYNTSAGRLHFTNEFKREHGESEFNRLDTAFKAKLVKWNGLSKIEQRNAIEADRIALRKEIYGEAA